jgi:hypothetical protein
LSAGPVVGRDAVIAMQRSWGLSGMDFDPAIGFEVGEYALRFGQLAVRYQGSEARFEFPFLSVHRVENGMLSERHDFGGYVGTLVATPELINRSESALTVGKEYLKAYLEGDLATQTVLLAEQSWFRDPTAAIYGPQTAAFGEADCGPGTRLVNQVEFVFASSSEPPKEAWQPTELPIM